MRINISGPVCATSYGLVTQNLIKALINLGAQISLRPIGPLYPDEACGYDKYINQCNPQMFAGQPHIILWHQFDLKKYLQPNAPNIGFPIFELDTFDAREQESLLSCDSLVTCSKWGADILAKYFKGPIGVVPLGVDPTIFFPYDSTIRTDTSPVKFVNMGKWEVRKGQIHVAKAFAEVFHNISDAHLTFACTNDFIGESENGKWANLMQDICGDKVTVLKERFPTHNEVNEFLNSQDIGVFPSHAEGWGLETVEMLELGKPCIATDYSGHTQFINDYNGLCRKITVDKLEPAFDGRWFFSQGSWASFGASQYEQLKTHMLEVYHEVKNSQKLGLTSPQYFGRINTWEKSANELLKFIGN